MKEENHISRMRDEMNELDERLKRLEAFISGDKFKQLSVTQQTLMEAQRYTMAAYLSILQQRISLDTGIYINQ